jgi:hypothetical protein
VVAVGIIGGLSVIEGCGVGVPNPHHPLVGGRHINTPFLKHSGGGAHVGALEGIAVTEGTGVIQGG